MWKPGTHNNDDWIAATASLPVAFAQVREDPLVDQRLLQRLGRRDTRVLMVASGGETAALLATLPIGGLHLVDMNQSQLDLTQLKLQLLCDSEAEQRLRLLGHASMPTEQRDQQLQSKLSNLGLRPDCLGPRDQVAELGPDFCGRYEWLFARLRESLRRCEPQLAKLMSSSDIALQSQLVGPGTDLGRQLEAAFEEVMDLSALIEIFGSDATANRAVPFSQHFLTQTRLVLGRIPAAENPFLHSIFLGRFPGPKWPWLELPRQSELCEVRYTREAMNSVLCDQPDRSYDLIHLSNILDWIDPEQASAVLADTYRCLTPGGLVVVRQLNSLLDIPSIPSGIRWMRETSEALHEIDRSFFYRALHVGKRA